MTTLIAIKVPSPHLIPNDDALVNYVEHGVIIAADTRFIWDLSKIVIPGDGLKVAGLSLYVLAGYSGDVFLAYSGLESAQDILACQGGSPDMIAEMVRSQLINAQSKIKRNRDPLGTSVLLGIWLSEYPVLYRLESSDGFRPRDCDGPEFAGHGGKELQGVFQDNLHSMHIGLRQRDKEDAELRGLPYDPSKPVEVRLLDLALQAGRSVESVSESYHNRGEPEVGGKLQVRVITSNGIENVHYATLDIADGRDVLEHRTAKRLLRPKEMGITSSGPTGESTTWEMKKNSVRKHKRRRT
jgi:hypothetical protein